MGERDDIFTAARLRFQQLQEYHLEPAPRPREDPPGPPAVHPRAPLDLGVVDQTQRLVKEVITHVRAEVPKAGPAPHGPAVYDWMQDHTQHLAPERAAVGRAMVYRQSLENAIATRDFDVIRREPCPRCGCWGLSWHKARRVVVCMNQRCTIDGVPTTLTLQQVAEHAVRRGVGGRTGTV